MNNKERLEKWEEEEYQEVFFEEMQRVLEVDYEQRHKKGGSPPKLSVSDKLVIMLQYYREYRRMRHIAFDYGIVKSTISEAVSWADAEQKRAVPPAIEKEAAGSRFPRGGSHSRCSGM